ncbi:type II secretion system minor pseudopilin GspJ [Aurantivibrio infirmus]
MKSRTKNWNGFTLVELLVAISITLIVATLAYGFFDSATQATADSEAVLQQVNSVETVWQVLNADLNHVIDRDLPQAAAGVASGQATPSFMGGDNQNSGANYLQGQYLLRFSRDGWANALQQQRSDLQRIGYRWLDGQLWRDYWTERNQPLEDEPTGSRLLLDKVTAIQVRFLPNTASNAINGPWQIVWPPQRQNLNVASNIQRKGRLPLALEVTLSIEELGDVQRIFALPGV